MKILGYEISTELPEIDLVGRKIINTINPHSYCIAKEDSLFRNALNESDVLLPDGIGIVFASKFLNGIEIRKIAGYEIFLYLMEKLNSKKGSCFFLGSSDNTLKLIKKRAGIDFPSVRIGAFSPPFKNKFSDHENEAMIFEVNNFCPDVLFVGMTAPKQEKWVYQNKAQLNTKVICSIGAVFDFYAGTVKRPSKLWISLGLEWLPRLLKEPKRLWKRNLISTPMFLFDIILLKMKLKRF